MQDAEAATGSWKNKGFDTAHSCCSEWSEAEWRPERYGLCLWGSADWVDHTLATGGEAYLRTPDDELPLFVRLSLDVWAVTLAAAAALLHIAIKALQLVALKLRAALTTKGSKKNQPEAASA